MAPCGVGPTTFIGLPFASRPLVHVAFTNGLPSRNSPVEFTTLSITVRTAIQIRYRLRKINAKPSPAASFWSAWRAISGMEWAAAILFTAASSTQQTRRIAAAST